MANDLASGIKDPERNTRASSHCTCNVDRSVLTDPNRNPSATHLPCLDYADAIEMADTGCPLVQRMALEVAQFHGVTVVIRSLAPERQTVVGHRPRPS